MLSNVRRRKHYFLILFTIIFFVAVTFHLSHGPTLQRMKASVYYQVYPQESIACYEATDLPRLPDLSTQPPRPGSSIFFFETSCASYHRRRIHITAREACAVESAAKNNPNLDIYLLYTSPGQILPNGTSTSDLALQQLQTYTNIHILHIDFDEYLAGTLLEGVYTDPSRLKASLYVQSHASDLLRYLTLYKFGGIYMDLDVVVIKSLEDLEGNYAGAESDWNVAAGVLRFDPTGVGHMMAEDCVRDLKWNYEPGGWGMNGPGVITRLSRKLCGTEDAINMTSCKGIHIYPPKYFYAIPWWNWTMYFSENDLQKVFHMSRDSYIIHVWNKHSVTKEISINEHVAYSAFAKNFCPRVISICDKYF